MRLAIGTDDQETLPKQHFGENRYFCVVDPGDSPAATPEYRANPASEGHGPGKRAQILQALQDCDALVGRGFGASLLTSGGGAAMQIILTSLARVDEVISAFRAGDMAPFKRFDPQSGKFAPMGA
jgi:predicted Fe-Mo cluster-binding NifX family protein